MFSPNKRLEPDANQLIDTHGLLIYPFNAMSFPSETLNLEVKEGLNLVFPASYPIALDEMYVLAAFMSAGLDGKSVLCINFLPGITLEIDTLWRVEDGVQALEDEWQSFQPNLYDWVEKSSPVCLCGVWFLGHSTLGLWNGNAHLPDLPAVKIMRKLAWEIA